MKPKAIAVIGASTKPRTIGSEIMLRLKEYNFNGKIYPVNPKADEICGFKAYPTVGEIPGDVDFAVIIIPSKFVLDAVDQCHAKGITGICIISAGFKETGKEGAELENQLAEKLKQHNMRCVGPNCLGVLNTNDQIKMDATFAESLPIKGDIGFVFSIRSFRRRYFEHFERPKHRLRSIRIYRKQADINAETMIEYWENDDDVKQILLYMESIQNPANFRKLATRVTKKKPIVALKAGRSAAGASAASSHTGSLAGADKAADALLKQSGVIREFSLKQLFATAKVFSNCPIPKGNRVAIITNSGGPELWQQMQSVNTVLKWLKSQMQQKKP
jgi:acetyltransferase